MLAYESLLHVPADPGDPCPGCMRYALENGVCEVCLAEFCEECGRVEVTGESACCKRCAPVYEVATPERPYYIGRSLRCAYEAHSYLHGAGVDDAMLLVPKRVRLDVDGLTAREEALIHLWDHHDGELQWVHTCIAPTRVGNG